MKTYSFANIVTGEFAGYTVMLPDDQLDLNIPAGHVAVEGRYADGRHRMDVAAGKVVAIDRAAEPAIAPSTEHARTSINQQRRIDLGTLTVEFGGHTYQADPASRQALLFEIAAVQIDPNRRTRWRDADNMDVPQSPDDLRALFLVMADAAHAVHRRAADAKDAL